MEMLRQQLLTLGCSHYMAFTFDTRLLFLWSKRPPFLKHRTKLWGSHGVVPYVYHICHVLYATSARQVVHCGLSFDGFYTCIDGGNYC